MKNAPDKLVPGVPIPALPSGSWNAFVDAWVLANKTKLRRQPLTKRSVSIDDSLRVRVRNDTGSDLTDDYNVVMIDDIDVEPDQDDEDVQFDQSLEKKALKVKAYDGEASHFCITQGVVPKGETVAAVTMGFSWVTVDISDVNHAYASPEKDVTDSLKSSDSPDARIVWKPPNETGKNLCLVYIGGSVAEMSVISGRCVEDVSPSEDIKIDQLEVLWGKLPEGKTANCETSEDCEFTCTNIFEQQYAADDIIVAFETIERTPPQTESPGHSNQSAQDHAAADAVTEHADEPAEGTDSGGEVEWWGFGVAASASRLFRTASTIGAASYSAGTSTLTLGQGTAQMFLPTTPGAATLQLEPDLLTIYSYVETEIQSGRNVMATLLHGKWIIHSEDCPAV